MMTKTATILYEGRIAENNEVFDDGTKEPYTITFGKAGIMPVIEKALLEMDCGEEKTFNLEPKDAYGEWEEKGVQRVLVKDIPNGENLPVGEYINWKNPVSIKPIPVKVLSKHNGIVKLDLNHPLAGKHINYWVKLIDKN